VARPGEGRIELLAMVGGHEHKRALEGKCHVKSVEEPAEGDLAEVASVVFLLAVHKGSIDALQYS